MLPLKRFQFSSDWRPRPPPRGGGGGLSRSFEKDLRALPLTTPLSSGLSRVWCPWFGAPAGTVWSSSTLQIFRDAKLEAFSRVCGLELSAEPSHCLNYLSVERPHHNDPFCFPFTSSVCFAKREEWGVGGNQKKYWRRWPTLNINIPWVRTPSDSSVPPLVVLGDESKLPFSMGW